ncbi:acyl-CoA synthase [Mycobacteroides abscessus subsp. abscessus]|nr:acyl-CoA synthase [Mycobacteroides abscessus subsp. abscessus]
MLTPIPMAERTALLIDLVAGWAVTKADDVALTYGDLTWTWSEWNDRIRRAAGVLAGAGVRRGDRIAFLDKNNPVCLEVVFAAASLGIATTVVNWRLAGDELRYVLQDSGSRIVFVGSEFRDRFDGVADQTPGVERIITVGGEVDGYEALLAGAPRIGPAADVADSDDCLIVYSSGTTGRPKGVVLSQQALVTHTIDVGTAFAFTGGDKNLVSMPLFHVGGICFALFGIRSGVPMIMTRDPDLGSLIGGLMSGATHAFLVPPVISGFLSGGANAIAAMSRLRYLVYGAAPMPLPLLRQALDTWPGINFVQVYGQTELAGVATTLNPVDHRDAGRPGLLLSAGTPASGTELRIVDLDSGLAIGDGSQGEIWVRTEHAMTRYLNRPEATAETVTSDGWVRTGDIGYIDGDGYLFVEDRLKDLIITGGENVYGPEVERVLLAHPAVADAAIIGVPDEHWGESIKAIVVAGGATAEDIIAFCREHLAGYKCPRTVEFVSALPRNASGKILKRELREPYWSDANPAV